MTAGKLVEKYHTKPNIWGCVLPLCVDWRALGRPVGGLPLSLWNSLYVSNVDSSALLNIANTWMLDREDSKCFLGVWTWHMLQLPTSKFFQRTKQQPGQVPQGTAPVSPMYWCVLAWAASGFSAGCHCPAWFSRLLPSWLWPSAVLSRTSCAFHSYHQTSPLFLFPFSFQPSFPAVSDLRSQLWCSNFLQL